MAKLLKTRIPAVFFNPPRTPGRKLERPPKWATFVDRVQEDVGNSAAEYFLDRGFRHFAFVGTPHPADWCERRKRGLTERLTRENIECAYAGAKRVRHGCHSKLPH